MLSDPTHSFLRGVNNNLSDVLCTAGHLNLIVNPSHVRKVTIPAMLQAFLNEHLFGLDNPQLTNQSTSRLQQRVERCVWRPDVNLATVQTLNPTAFPLDFLLTANPSGRLNERLLDSFS